MDRHKDGSVVVTIRISAAMHKRLLAAMEGNRTPRPMDSIGAYIKWLIETQLLRVR